MKKLVIALIIGAVILGISIAGGDCTLALFIVVIFYPEIFQKKRRRKAVRKYVQSETKRQTVCI